MRHSRPSIGLPTNKIRTVNIEDPIVFSPGETFALHSYQFNYPNLYEIAGVGEEVIVNDAMNHLWVAKVDGDVIELRAGSAGRVANAALGTS